jgi:hypothetical protein
MVKFPDKVEVRIFTFGGEKFLSAKLGKESQEI